MPSRKNDDMTVMSRYGDWFIPASVQTLRRSAPLKSSDNFTTASQSVCRQWQRFVVIQQLKGSVKETNISIYFFFLPIAQWCSISDVPLIKLPLWKQEQLHKNDQLKDRTLTRSEEYKVPSRKNDDMTVMRRYGGLLRVFLRSVFTGGREVSEFSVLKYY